jgi:hypothetical protein
MCLEDGMSLQSLHKPIHALSSSKDLSDAQGHFFGSWASCDCLIFFATSLWKLAHLFSISKKLPLDIVKREVRAQVIVRCTKLLVHGT